MIEKSVENFFKLYFLGLSSFTIDHSSFKGLKKKSEDLLAQVTSFWASPNGPLDFRIKFSLLQV